MGILSAGGWSTMAKLRAQVSPRHIVEAIVYAATGGLKIASGHGDGSLAGPTSSRTSEPASKFGPSCRCRRQLVGQTKSPSPSQEAACRRPGYEEQMRHPRVRGPRRRSPTPNAHPYASRLARTAVGSPPGVAVTGGNGPPRKGLLKSTSSRKRRCRWGGWQFRTAAMALANPYRQTSPHRPRISPMPAGDLRSSPRRKSFSQQTCDIGAGIGRSSVTSAAM
jgi:hypothetical protein